MKRFFFSLIALAAAAVSCTQSALLETPTLDGTPVSFSPYTGRTPVTKATSIATATELGAEGGFNVYCFLNGDQTNPLLAAEPVTMTDGVWGYTNTIFWPASGSLDFVAYSANAKDYLTDASSTGFTFEVPESIDEQVDLLATAYQAGNNATSDGNVTLTFYHLLSRVGFKVETGSPTPITINSISLTGNMPDAGTLTYKPEEGKEEDAPALDPLTSTSKTYFYHNTPVVLDNGASTSTVVPGKENDYLMIMPHTASSGHTIAVNYTIGSTTKEVTAELPENFVFAQGKAYEFILKISTSKLTFDVTEDEWDEAEIEADIPTVYTTVDEKTTSEYGFVYNVISYDYEKSILEVRIDILDITKVPAGAYGLRISWSNNKGTKWNQDYLRYGEDLKQCNKTNGYDYAYLTKTKSFTVYLKHSSLTKDVEEYAFICSFYSPSSMASTLKGSSDYYKYFSTKKTFDYSSYYNEDPTAAPIVAIENISVNQKENSASLRASIVEGISPVKTRGFCWKKGEGIPTTGDNKIVCAESETFSGTIAELSAGIYTCRAYVITKAGKTYYSELRTIEIEDDSVTEEDNTGSGSWEGGDGEIEY